MRANSLPMGLSFYALAFLGIWFVFRPNAAALGQPRPVEPFYRNLGLLFIMATAGFFRFYHLSVFPWGFFPDEARMGREKRLAELEALAGADIETLGAVATSRPAE